MKNLQNLYVYMLLLMVLMPASIKPSNQLDDDIFFDNIFKMLFDDDNAQSATKTVGTPTNLTPHDNHTANKSSSTTNRTAWKHPTTHQQTVLHVATNKPYDEFDFLSDDSLIDDNLFDTLSAQDFENLSSDSSSSSAAHNNLAVLQTYLPTNQPPTHVQALGKDLNWTMPHHSLDSSQNASKTSANLQGRSFKPADNDFTSLFDDGDSELLTTFDAGQYNPNFNDIAISNHTSTFDGISKRRKYLIEAAAEQELGRQAHLAGQTAYAACLADPDYFNNPNREKIAYKEFKKADNRTRKKFVYNANAECRNQEKAKKLNRHHTNPTRKLKQQEYDAQEDSKILDRLRKNKTKQKEWQDKISMLPLGPSLARDTLNLSLQQTENIISKHMTTLQSLGRVADDGTIIRKRKA